MDTSSSLSLTANLLLVISALFTIGLCFLYLVLKKNVFENLSGIIRNVVVLSTEAVRIALLGFIELRDNSISEFTSMIKAGDSLAVFAIVYLFNPLN